MLPARERLSRSGLFQRAYSARKSISSPIATLYVLPRTKQASRGGSTTKDSGICTEMPLSYQTVARMPLVGFVIAKKVCKSACVRNRTKRRVREAYRLLRHTTAAQQLSLDQWYALVWVIHEKALGASWEEIQAMVRELLAKARTRFGAKERTVLKEDGSYRASP